VLTKRAERMRELLETRLRSAASRRHIWWGVSVEDRRYGFPRIEHLRRAPASVRFLSIEPLLGEPSGFSRLAAPIMAAAMRRANRKDLDHLKAILEAKRGDG
jgi:protein gp37